MDDLRVLNDDDTLPDDAWKDSFDKLLDERPALREMKVIKRDVRASFNMDSSYENSCCDNPSRNSPRTDSYRPDTIVTSKRGQLEVPNIALCKAIGNLCDNTQTISTPLRIRDTTNHFECALSPIGVWENQNLKKNCNQNSEPVRFSATPLKYSVHLNIPENASVLCNEVQSISAKPKSQLSLVMENIMSKRSSKRVYFDTKVTGNITASNGNIIGVNMRPVSLQPGKWRKSLNLWRRAQSTPMDNVCNRASVGQKYGSGAVLVKESKSSRNTLAASHRKSMLNRKYLSLTNNVNEKNFQSELLLRCGQNIALAFEDVYDEYYLQHCCKIGEGAFGEVFLYKKPHGKKEGNTVLKIIPIEGKDLINGETQKSYEQILQEVVICMELCALNDKKGKTNFTPGFVNLQKVQCVTGQYPAQLQKLWEEYDDKKESENDHPGCFNSGQIFVVLEMAFSGEDMESFVFQNAEQSFYALHQIIYTLAVGEEVYQFEHRDLHWGNVLVLGTKAKHISYKLDNKILTLPTKGIRITIIDYTLSRITYNNGCYYNDLSCDPDLFTATGDYQFDIYRMMRGTLKDKWEKFEPKTNIFWTSYIISKLLDGASYNKSLQKVHLQYMEKLKHLNSTILTYSSCKDCALDLSSKLK